MSRRRLLTQGAAVLGWLSVTPVLAQAQGQPQPQQPPGATPQSTAQLSGNLALAVTTYTGGAVPTPGRVLLDIATIVENGNTVPVTVSVESPMTAADHCASIALFNERNPQRDVIRARLTPMTGKAELSTRMRLATTQRLAAVARMSDGSWWMHQVDVVVTLAACIEEIS